MNMLTSREVATKSNILKPFNSRPSPYKSIDRDSWCTYPLLMRGINILDDFIGNAGTGYIRSLLFITTVWPHFNMSPRMPSCGVTKHNTHINSPVKSLYSSCNHLLLPKKKVKWLARDGSRFKTKGGFPRIHSSRRRSPALVSADLR